MWVVGDPARDVCQRGAVDAIEVSLDDGGTLAAALIVWLWSVEYDDDDLVGGCLTMVRPGLANGTCSGSSMPLSIGFVVDV